VKGESRTWAGGSPAGSAPLESPHGAVVLNPHGYMFSQADRALLPDGEMDWSSGLLAAGFVGGPHPLERSRLRRDS